LPPGRAAGIKKAQGIEGDRYWLEAGLIIGALSSRTILAGIDGSDEANRDDGSLAARADHRSNSR
jgi:hypothetical protein